VNRISFTTAIRSSCGWTAPSILNRYLWGPDIDQLFADEDASEEVVRWALGDHQNSVRDLAEFDIGDEEDPEDDATTVVDHRSYSSFGVEAYDSSSSVETVFGFTGRFFDDAFKIQYNTHRWYDPALQQWLSVDPILFRAGDPNPRRYVGNDPVIRPRQSMLGIAPGAVDVQCAVHEPNRADHGARRSDRINRASRVLGYRRIRTTKSPDCRACIGG